MSGFVLDTAYVVEQYEGLRREALDPPWKGSVGQGLSLFLSRGMCAWMEALDMIKPPPAGRYAETPLWKNELPAPVRCDVTLLLADMVIACHGREMGNDGIPRQDYA